MSKNEKNVVVDNAAHAANEAIVSAVNTVFQRVTTYATRVDRQYNSDLPYVAFYWHKLTAQVAALLGYNISEDQAKALNPMLRTLYPNRDDAWTAAFLSNRNDCLKNCAAIVELIRSHAATMANAPQVADSRNVARGRQHTFGE